MNGPALGSTAGISMIRPPQHPATSAGPAATGRPPVSRANSRPPMNLAEGTGSPKAFTFTSVSRAGSSAAGRPPTAIDITQVPVETTANGAGRAKRCGTSEALESWMPH